MAEYRYPLPLSPPYSTLVSSFVVFLLLSRFHFHCLSLDVSEKAPYRVRTTSSLPDPPLIIVVLVIAIMMIMRMTTMGR